jgi:hypothetical protein
VAFMTFSFLFTKRCLCLNIMWIFFACKGFGQADSSKSKIIVQNLNNYGFVYSRQINGHLGIYEYCVIDLGKLDKNNILFWSVADYEKYSFIELMVPKKKVERSGEFGEILTFKINPSTQLVKLAGEGFRFMYGNR